MKCIEKRYSRLLPLISGKWVKKSFFDFDQNTILTRLKLAATFQDCATPIYNDPDLYNPLWINVTLCFAFSILGNISKYLTTSGDQEYAFDFSLVQRSFSLVFGLSLIVPALIVLFFFLFGTDLNLKLCVGIMAIYSYSNLFFLIGSFVNLIPIKLIKLIVMGGCALLSTAFLVVNYSRFIDNTRGNKRKAALIFVIVFQGLALITYYINFYA